MTSSPATVMSRTEIVPGIVELVLRPQRAPTIPPGSHIDVTVPLPGGTETRSYSLVDLGRADGCYRIAVRLDENGRGGSRWMHTLQPGATVEVTDPISNFAPSPGGQPSVLLAGGIGITPIVGLARALRAAGAEPRIIYTGRSRDQMAFVEHLEREHPGQVTVVESDLGTHLDADDVVAEVPDDGVLYVCGPVGLLTAVGRAWERSGRPAANLRFETFGTSGEPSTPFRVEVPARGLSVDVPQETSILDALEAAGVEMMYSCRRGECGLCRVAVLAADGELDHRDVFLSERQQAEGRMLCSCVSRTTGTSLTIAV
ncbi:PDR/VanB family oxidoreductase [Streptomyces sp. NBC_01361]|uniref:PDR/VanB family oxidoreductase n=1 Tax=Streptomyces sp. NBC_01361 TaxID=2903838 RepID=UPI002E351657|nr:PDR/VanB family oxidoreductase [Streptomyces sp. NBC_01361]